MKERTKHIITAAVVVGTMAVTVVPAFAGQPGPGDKQCIPGQQGNPQPAHKGGVCPNP
jgi:hypothetical protein